MIVNTAVSPHADERRNSALLSLFLADSTLLRQYSAKEVYEVDLIREFHKNQTSIPRSEISVTVDNRDNFFDLTNPDSALYQLTKKSYCEGYLSSVTYGKADSFIKKCRLFYDSFFEGVGTITLKYTDAVSHSDFSTRYMTAAFNEINKTTADAKEILEGIRLETGYPFEYAASDEIAEKMNFSKSSFMNDSTSVSIKDGLFEMATRLTTSFKSPVYFMIDDSGAMMFKKQLTAPTTSITRKHFINYEIKQGKDCLISCIKDRGNVLYELGDIIEVVDGNKSFQTEIYKIHYRLANGNLSSEWEGVII